MVSPARKSEQTPEKESPLTGSLQICNFLNHMAFNADLDSIRVRMTYWGPIVAIASIRWWLDRVVRIKRGERGAALAGRPVTFHTGELHVRLERFNATWQ